MADNENHPLVDLMLARMDTHPEEFDGSNNRWYTTLIDIDEYAPPEQAALIKAKIAAIRLDAAHHRAMDELLNGEERRRQKAEVELVRNTYAQQAQQSALRQQLQGYQNAANTLQGAYPPGSWLSAADVQPTQLKLGSETLDEGILKKIKGALKL
jgi:hypothetical protein